MDISLAFQQTYKNLLSETILFMPKVVIALIIFVVFWVAGNLFRRMVRQIGAKTDPRHRDALRLLGQTTKITLISIGTISALGTLGVNVSAMVAGLGLTGFALGFALKDALSNLLAGVMILVYRPFKEGDQINVSGFEGCVTRIDLRYTTLQGTGSKILIPNSVLFTNTIKLVETATTGQPP
jgi:small conductance mechanosensitive channel